MAFSSAHHDLQRLQPLPRAEAHLPKRGPSCHSRPAAVGAAVLGGPSPLEAEGTCQKPTSQQSPLPVCNLTRQPCPVDRDPGKSSLPGEKEAASGVLPLPSPTSRGSSPCAKDLLTPALLSGQVEAGEGCVSDQVRTGVHRTCN